MYIGMLEVWEQETGGICDAVLSQNAKNLGGVKKYEEV